VLGGGGRSGVNGATSGIANTGGGGAGAWTGTSSPAAGSGGSGIVIIRYPYNDGTPPTLAGSGIVDDKSGDPVQPYTLVTYTVTFSEDMDSSTVTAADFGNTGSAAFTIGSVTETAPGVFTVQATPIAGGTLQLRVNAGADLKDVAGNALVTTSAIPDDTTLTVVPTPGNTGYGGVITYTDSSGLNPVASPPYIGGYVVHKYTNSGTLNMPIPASAEVLVVGGGGGGGGTSFGAGGGAGGLVYRDNFAVTSSATYTVTVGGGGAGGASPGASGSNSVFGTLTALGGGGGAGRSSRTDL
jgi:hypothetical protein